MLAMSHGDYGVLLIMVGVTTVLDSVVTLYYGDGASIFTPVVVLLVGVLISILGVHYSTKKVHPSANVP